MRRVVKTFSSTVALRGVSVTFNGGIVTLVEGANGSGKSTLLGILGTVIRANSGAVDYEPLGRDLQIIRNHIGWLSHETLAYPDLTGWQNIELAASAHGVEAGPAWTKVAGRFGLGTFASRPVRTCSRGQRQRIALARALIHEPSLILLDEPTAGLDRDGVSQLLSIIQEEVSRGAIVVVVSHEPEAFRAHAPKQVTLVSGRTVQMR